ncbi:MAG: hypothetical protein K940chlam7_00913 [Chlamydiae bacterium]|nr:hypothetical protein [Chlamydiota bacterium]
MKKAKETTVFLLFFLTFFYFDFIQATSTPDTFEDSIVSINNVVEGIDENSCEYYVSICAFFKDEGDYLKEWIEYHRLIGIEHFYLYNNNSCDNYLEVLQPYIKKGLVDLIDWPSPEGTDWTPYQEQAFNHCIELCIGHTRWLAVIDIDEFIIPVDRPTLKSFLIDFDHETSLGGIMMFWQCYGTSWVKTIPDNKLMIECLTWKAPWDHSWNRQVKSICKPHKVSHYCVHGAHYKSGYHDITTSGTGGPNQPIQIDRIRVNHYWTRTEDYFLNVKVPRRAILEGREYTPEQIQAFFQSFNTVEDKAIFRFLPELRELIFKK